MYQLYLAKGTSGLATHILLEEIGANYETHFLSIPEGEHLAPDMLQLNPRGRLPTLVTPQGPLAENPAILAYLSHAHPEHNLMPIEPFAFAKAQSVNLYLAATLHVAFAHKARARRWADEANAVAAMQAKVPKNIAEGADFIETHLLAGPWVLGADFSACDAYVFLAHRWMAATGVNLAHYPKLAAHTEAMRARPAVARALEQHGL
ncbi:MAG: glutathione S-transferase family protein [Pseudomonadota bacterium]